MKAALLACSLLVMSASAWAADPQLRINSAAVDCSAGTLTLAGDFGDPLTTALALTLDTGAGPTLLAQVGRTATQVVAELPGRKCEPAGTHRLSVDLAGQTTEKVQTTSGNVRPVQFHSVLDLTLGAVGPRGETGAQGERGASGADVLSGRSCPAGMFVAGFGAGAVLVCSAGSASSGYPPIAIASAAGDFLARHWTQITVIASDLDPGDTFRYDARVVSQPAGSQAMLASEGTPTPSLLGTLPGQYQLTGTVTDSNGNVGTWHLTVQLGACSTVPPTLATFKVSSLSPPAAPNPPAETLQCTVSGGWCDVVLPGIGLDAIRVDATVEDPAAVTCFSAPIPSLEWSLATVPVAAQVQLIGATTISPWFVPPVGGAYVLSVKLVGAGGTSEYGVIVNVRTP